MDTLFGRSPQHLDARYPILIEEFIDLNLAGNNEAVTAMIRMLADLREHGRDCRYIKNLTGTPLMELKPTARGGVKGGARVYFWVMPDDAAGVVNCEVKAPDAPTSLQKLKVALEVYVAHQEGVAVLTPGQERTR